MRTAKYLSGICLLAAFLYPFASKAQNASTPANTLPFTLKPLGHGVYAAIDDTKGDAGANAGFVIGDDGVLVIDTFENEAAAKLLLAEIRKLTKLPIKFVVNTHYHLDHVAGNRVFQAAGAVILAEQSVFYWIHDENLKFFGKDIKPEQKAMVAALAAPEVLYSDGIILRLGSRNVEVAVRPGHTGGDSIVTIVDASVVFCGDLFWKKTLPNLIDASTEPWTKTLEPSSEGPSVMTFVPGHGDVGNSADVKAFRDYLLDLRNMVSAPLLEGKSGDDLVNAVMPGLKAKYGDWNFFDYFAKPNILDMAAELNHKKRTPPIPQMM
jgi:glyoxylase-like metal-dependent hydrolase (beta-lactamase superfamily II)